ncbi:BQ5605_C030g10830 [Microbotryum silenes-dioicae]|uniref:BQ5605_C030g10830 protein n=1 Tax=Microbotryum silenes-dioicae TaxID=796604 RepID=A0A2X0PCD0_9BASI|nr:BQ5605_C030g10830 [Microbotryum silenes-dioicae]
MQKTFRALGFVPSSKSTRRLMVLMHDASTVRGCLTTYKNSPISSLANPLN